MKKRTQLKIERLGNFGEGIAYIKNKPVFVNYALIGEEVEVELVKNNRGNLEGQNLKVLTPSPIRVEPPCQYYYKCGGCNLQHMPYFEMIKYKRNVINFLFNVNLRKETKHTKLNYTILSPEEYRYRNRVILPITIYNNKISYGLYYQDSNRFLSIDTCLIHKLNIDLILKEITNLMTKYQIEPYNSKTKSGYIRFIQVRTNYQGQFQITFISYKKVDLTELANDLAANNPKVNSVFVSINDNLRSREFITEKIEKLYGDDYLEDKIGDTKYLVGPDSFFQLNLKQAKNMYDEILRVGNFTKNDTILDAYAGVSSIGIYISKFVDKVYSIEISKDAVKAAKEAVKFNNIDNIEIHSGDTLEVSKQLNIKPNVMIFNPPRTGLGKDLCNFILEEKPKKIIYASCNPLSLVDDLKILSNKYNIIETTPVDMFPQTNHVESVTLLTLKTK